MSNDLVLASASPRRAELLRQLGVSFRQYAADIDESQAVDESADEYVGRMARDKAIACERALVGDARPVLAADTCVVLDGQILGKPRDAVEALAMLTQLSGREHRVLTAVCLRFGNYCGECFSDTRVQFVDLQRHQLEAYVATGEPLDKAGAYGIQGLAGAFVLWLQGSYSGVVGLPLAQTWLLLQEIGVASSLQATGNERGSAGSGASR